MLRGEDALLWAMDKFKHHSGGGNPLFRELVLGAGGFTRCLANGFSVIKENNSKTFLG